MYETMKMKIKIHKILSTSFNSNGRQSYGHKDPIESLHDNAKKTTAKIFKSEKNVGNVFSNS